MAASDDEKKARTASRIAGVRDRFLKSLPDRTGALASLARTAAGSDPAEAVPAADSLRLGLHNLSGAAPTLGLLELGRRAGVLEARLIKARLCDGRLPEDVARMLADEIAALADAVD